MSLFQLFLVFIVFTVELLLWSIATDFNRFSTETTVQQQIYL